MSPHGPADHCAACAAVQEQLSARAQAGQAMAPARLEAVRAAAQRELVRRPVARGWPAEAACLFGAVALATAGATALHGGFDPQVGSAPFAAHLALGLALLTAALFSVAPGGATARLLVLTGGALSLLAVAAVRSASAVPWLAHGWGCAVWVAALALAPLAAGSWLLCGFARSRGREALLGLCCGSVGVLSLGLTCPGDGALHVGVFHVGACLLVVGAALQIGRLLPRRSYAP